MQASLPTSFPAPAAQPRIPAAAVVAQVSHNHPRSWCCRRACTSSLAVEVRSPPHPHPHPHSPVTVVAVGAEVHSVPVPFSPAAAAAPASARALDGSAHSFPRNAPLPAAAVDATASARGGIPPAVSAPRIVGAAGLRSGGPGLHGGAVEAARIAVEVAVVLAIGDVPLPVPAAVVVAADADAGTVEVVVVVGGAVVGVLVRDGLDFRALGPFGRGGRLGAPLGSRRGRDGDWFLLGLRGRMFDVLGGGSGISVVVVGTCSRMRMSWSEKTVVVGWVRGLGVGIGRKVLKRRMKAGMRMRCEVSERVEIEKSASVLRKDFLVVDSKSTP